MKRFIAISSVVLAFAAAPVAAQAAQLLVNGGFEGGPAENNNPVNHNTRGAGPPEGWSTLDGYENPDIINTGYAQGSAPFMVLLGPRSGDRFLDMNGVGPTGGMFQDITGLEVGSIVTLNFWVARWAQNSAGDLNYSLRDAVTGDALNSDTVTIAFDNTVTQSAWFQRSLTATVGASGAVRVQFTADSSSNSRGAPGLDDVTLDGTLASSTVVPEPGIWALMIAGFGMAGAAMRRRRAPA
jgi:hypothetical protein